MANAGASVSRVCHGLPSYLRWDFLLIICRSTLLTHRANKKSTMNALFLMSALALCVDPNVDLPRQIPDSPDLSLPIPLGNPDPGPWLRLRIDGSTRLVLDERLWITDTDRGYLQCGWDRLAVVRSWFIGREFSASVGVESGSRGFGLPVTLNWFPMAGISIELGLDFLRLRPVFALMIPL